MTTDAFTWVVPVLDLKNKFERIIKIKNRMLFAYFNSLIILKGSNIKLIFGVQMFKITRPLLLLNHT